MQDFDTASAELTHCVKELGMVGALVNGFSQRGTPETLLSYDLPQYRDFWKRLSAMPTRRHNSAMLDSPRRSSRTIRIFSSGEWRLRVARRRYFTIRSDGDSQCTGFCFASTR